MPADRLYAVAPGTDTSPVRARDTAALVDADETSWLSWNKYAEEFLADTGATRIPIDDDGIGGCHPTTCTGRARASDRPAMPASAGCDSAAVVRVRRALHPFRQAPIPGQQ
jgi:hypothetical protein